MLRNDVERFRAEVKIYIDMDKNISRSLVTDALKVEMDAENLLPEVHAIEKTSESTKKSTSNSTSNFWIL